MCDNVSVHDAIAGVVVDIDSECIGVGGEIAVFVILAAYIVSNKIVANDVSRSLQFSFILHPEMDSSNICSHQCHVTDNVVFDNVAAISVVPNADAHVGDPLNEIVPYEVAIAEPEKYCDGVFVHGSGVVNVIIRNLVEDGVRAFAPGSVRTMP